MFRKLKVYGKYIRNNFLLLVAAGAVIVLLTVQSLLLGQDARSYLSLVDRLEGEPLLSQPAPEGLRSSVYDNPVLKRLTTLRESALLKLTMVRPAANDRVFVTVNGKTAGNFAVGELTVKVYDGDYVEIDASAVSQAVQLIIATGDRVENPVNGKILEGRAQIITLGKIKLR